MMENISVALSRELCFFHGISYMFLQQLTGFLPDQGVRVSIVNHERRRSIGRAAFSHYLYTVEVTHGSYKWTVFRYEYLNIKVFHVWNHFWKGAAIIKLCFWKKMFSFYRSYTHFVKLNAALNLYAVKHPRKPRTVWNSQDKVCCK